MAGRRGATKANACSYDIASDEEGEAQLAVAGAGCAEAGSEPTDGARERPGGEDGAALADNGSVASDNEDEEAGSGTAVLGSVSLSTSSSSSSSSSSSASGRSCCCARGSSESVPYVMR